ncbi:hypothetical protein ABT324_19040 [Saccharopolyspora sp. NPDC000359]|uniref:hypothetical protein n=1 Tax=Saccharopolyspora sp. NPDC000359 TaxID=3154251 RepID=UPI00331EEA20
MCVDPVPPPASHLTRRGVLTAAAVLAGTTAMASAPRAEAAPHPAPPAGDLVIDGGNLLNPATGEVVEDSVVVIRGGVVRAAGPRDRVEVPAGVARLDARGRWVLPGLVDAHIHLNTASEARDAVRKGATSARSGFHELLPGHRGARAGPPGARAGAAAAGGGRVRHPGPR